MKVISEIFNFVSVKIKSTMCCVFRTNIVIGDQHHQIYHQQKQNYFAIYL